MKKFIQNHSHNIKHLISQSLIRRRIYLGLSHAQIAADIDISPKQIQQYESGK